MAGKRMNEFSETTGSLARKAEVEPDTIRHYANEGLIECIRLANGQRLFRPSAVKEVRTILRERLARRGRRSAA
jgi:DNA-binding transcriptional MerR regulator